MSITSIANNTPARIAAGVLGIAMALSLAFGSVVTPAQAQTVSIDALLAQIAALQAQLLALQGGSSAGAGVCPFTWTRNLQQGATGSDVMKLQQFLNSDAATMVAASGAGSKGSETSTFGPATKAAVVKFQNKYKADVLTPVGLSAGTGFVGAATRAKLNALCASATPTTPTTPTTPSTGTSLQVSAAAQPANSLAPYNAARVPFTKFTVTAGLDGDIVLNGVTVERVGLATDGNFTGVMLLDENGNQLGITRTLNSNHQTTVGEAVTIPRGTSKTFTVAANMNTAANVSAGSVAAFSVVALNTSATVSGSLPITGANHTVNATLALGTVTTARGSFDPGSNQTKEVGTTGYTFSSVKITAGSAEKVYVKSIRWNQTGSAAAGTDLKNVKTVVDGVSYDVIVSADGKYYTTNFPGSGLLIDKGFNKDVSIKGDIVGGSGRTVDFDIAKRSDLYIVGETYGYGILAPLAGSAASADSSNFNNQDDYYFDASQVTVSTGSMTVSTWTGISAQNIAENQNNQILGGWSVDVKGEAIAVGNMIFNLYETSSTADFDDIDSVSLVDQNGAVIAGPVDAATLGDGVTSGKVTFTDSVTFPVGVTNIVLKGKLGTDFANNDTIAASTTPGSAWTSVTGQTTGNTITPSPSSALTGPTMTLKAGTLAISVSSVPIAQNVIAGSNDFEFARYIFDATASGEDLRMTTIPLYFDTTGTRTDLTNCRLFDGATQLTTGGNVKNPATSDTASSTTFTFDGTGLVLSKGTSKTISLKCNIRSGVTSAYWWGIDASGTFSASGITSGTSVTPTASDSSGQTMTASAGGTLSVNLDTNSPGYKIVSGGNTGVELARIRFSAANEDIDLRQVALQLSSVASNTPVDLVNREVKLYDESNNLIGSAVFPTGDNATSSTIATGAFRVPRDGSKILIVKGDIAAITASGPLTSSGDLLVVDYDGDNESGTNGTYGVGVSSGSNRVPSASDSASSGVRIMKSYPVLTRLAVPSNTIASGADKSLYRFSVTATDNDVALYKVTFNISSSTGTGAGATTSAWALYAYTSSDFATADTTFDSQGKLNEDTPVLNPGTGANTDVNVLFQRDAGTNVTYVIPKGATRYFEFRATLSTVETGSGSETFDVKLLGDAAFPVNASTLMQNASGVDGDTNDDFIWSPISTTTQNTINDLDFTNGYQVQGLPSPAQSAQTFTSAN